MKKKMKDYKRNCRNKKGLTSWITSHDNKSPIAPYVVPCQL